MNDFFTIIIPTYNNRHDYLDRILDYYSLYPVNIIIADASEHAFDTKGRENVKYLHFPNYAYGQKMHLAMNEVSTKYSLLCADDDFIIPNAINKCVGFLESNSQYASVQGYIIGFHYEWPYNFLPFMLQANDIDINDEKAIDRIDRFYQQHMYLHYSVHKTENLRNTFEIAKEFDADFVPHAGEQLLNFICLINGPHKVIPIFYSASEVVRVSARHLYKQVYELIKEEKFAKDYSFMVDSISLHLSKSDNLELIDAKTYVANFFKERFGGPLVFKAPESPLKKFPLLRKAINKMYLIEKAKKYYNKVYVFEKRLNKTLRFKRSLRNSKSKMKGQYSWRGSKEEWSYIKKIIKKHVAVRT